jgi:CRP-like cAMP-binding protein/cytochrome P450
MALNFRFMLVGFYVSAAREHLDARPADRKASPPRHAIQQRQALVSLDSSHAPLAPGLPLLGSGLAAAHDPCHFFARCHRELGPVFRVAYPGRTMVMMAGLEANRLFALEGERVFSSAGTYARVTRELGTDAYPNAHDGARHKELRRLLAPSLSAMAIEPFLGRVFELIHSHASAWGPGSVQRASRSVGSLVTDVVALCTTGRTVGRRLSRDIDLWSTMMGVVAVGHVLPEFTLYLPPIRAARRRLTDFLEAALEDHRLHGPGRERLPDVLDALLAEAARQPGQLDATRLLALSMIPIKNAGIYLYRLISFVLYELIRRPPLLEAATAEVDEAFADGVPAIGEVRRMRTLQGVVLECLRLHPMALALPRVVAEEFELGGFRFRPGETVYIAGPVTHFDATLFPDPEAFDPERYSLRRCEHRRPHAFAPFGLGPHACAARGYSQALSAAVVAGLIRAVRMRVEPEGHQISLWAVPNPIPEAKFRFRVLEHRTPPSLPAAPPALRERIASALWELSPERRDAVFAGLEQRLLPAGTTVFRQGDPADHFYVIRRGEVEVVLEQEGREPRVVARLGPGDHFGEIGVLQGVPRNATVRTASEATLLGLGREAFNDLAVEADVTMEEVVQLMERRAMATNLARALPLLDADAVGRLASVCTRRSFDEGATILREGDPADAFYVLVRGRVELSVQPPTGAPIVVAHLDAVDFFGELGLLQRRPRSASARAVSGPVTVLEMPRARFEEMVAGSAATRDDLGRIAGERLLGLALAEVGSS